MGTRRCKEKMVEILEMTQEFKIFETVDRPSYFGKKRDEIQAGYDKKYGKGNWQIMWEIDGGIHSFDDAIQLYEDAYYEFLKNNPKVLHELCKTASHVYDNAESNIDCMGYHDQENNSNHYQDIAIDRSVWRLGRKLNGKQLIQIRHNSKDEIGRLLSPGRIDFHLPKYIKKPVKKGWWNPLTIEEFWQSNKVLQAVKKKNKN